MTKINLQPSDTYVVIDFEATCDHQNFPKDQMEIIEFAAVLVDKDYKVLWEFFPFVKPTLRPKLTKFCSEITSISQSDVDHANSFPEVIQEFKEFIKGYDPIFCSWGNYDRTQLRQDCNLHSVQYPFDNRHINLKKECAKALNVKPKGMGSMLRHLGLKFDGTPHGGIDDVKNIITIVKYISNMPIEGIKEPVARNKLRSNNESNSVK